MHKVSLFRNQKLLCGISTRADGNIDFRFGSWKEVERNRARLFQKREADPRQVVEMEQVHKTTVIRVDGSHAGTVVPEADGAITNAKGTLMMLRVADCIPVFLFDPEHRAIGLVHSGWKGTVGKIVLVAIQRMMLEFKTDPAKLLMALGPSIRMCCNIWKEPPIELKLPEWSPFVRQRKEGYALDLPGFVRETARNAGVRQENIEVSPTCTVMDEALFSFKRSKETGKKEGRIAAVIGLEEPNG